MDHTLYEIRPLTPDDLSLAPTCFQHPGTSTNQAFRRMNYLMFFVEGDPIPYYYARNNDMENTLAYGIVQLGDGPVTVQRPTHCRDLAGRDTPVSPYHPGQGTALFTCGSAFPYSEQTYYPNYLHIRERDVLDVKCEYWPVALFTHKGFMSNEYLYQAFTVTGTYEGKPIMGLGQFDGVYCDPEHVMEAYADIIDYALCHILTGIREDGRREFFYGQVHKDPNHGAVVYWLEGQEPIVCDDAQLDAEFSRLAYLPEEDPTCACTKAVWKFAGMEIQFQGQWGSRRFTDDPIHDKVGHSNSFGTWAVSGSQATYRMTHSFGESTIATVDKLQALGFSVV